jgi:hypothetical protein
MTTAQIAAGGLSESEQAPGYIFGAFVFTYGTTDLGASRNFLLIAVLVQAVMGFCGSRSPDIRRTASAASACI